MRIYVLMRLMFYKTPMVNECHESWLEAFQDEKMANDALEREKKAQAGSIMKLCAETLNCTFGARLDTREVTLRPPEDPAFRP